MKFAITIVIIIATINTVIVTFATIITTLDGTKKVLAHFYWMMVSKVR